MPIPVDGFFRYKDVPVHQNPDCLDVFRAFLLKNRFTHILEIGTGFGGFAMFLKDTLPNAKIVTYDIVRRDSYNILSNYGVDAKIRQVFSDEINLTDHTICYSQLDPEKVNCYKEAKLVDIEARDFLAEYGRKLILCDGGHKVSEFKCLASFLRTGDFIMAHDYAESYEKFNSEIRNKYWDWCEVEEKYIAEPSKQYGLEFYNQDVFSKIAWVCKQKAFSMDERYPASLF